MTVRRRVAASLAIVVALGTTACAPALPETVVPGSVVTVGWDSAFTSANAAASPTAGNIDIAAMTRAAFGDVVDGDFVPDEGFGTVSIIDDEPFTVRYDLAEPAWSDGIPLDAADLLLGWAAASGQLAGDQATEGGVPTEATPDVPRIDEFARAIEVTYPQPVSDWQERLVVAVPAHVVAGRALDVDDPMAAKQALLTAVRDGDTQALAAIAQVWNDGFGIPDDGAVPAELLISSGPFRVEDVTTDADGRRIALTPNPAYRGTVTAKVARIDLVPPGDDPLAEIGQTLDAVHVAPVASNREPIDALERKDFTVATTPDGTVWALLIRPAGVFTEPAARAAFLRAIPARALIERGGGAWASAYTASTSMLAAPGSRAYDIVEEDAGFAAALGGADDPLQEREAAGIAAGTTVCVLHDRTSEFAVGAFAAVRDAAAEAGWSVVDCGVEDLPAGLEQGAWEAVIMRVPVPEGASRIAAQWGSGGAESLVGWADPQLDALIAQFAQAADVYAARDLRAQIEAGIVRAAVALPIAVNPVVTIVDKDVTGVAARSGVRAPLTSDAEQWAVVP